LRAGEPAKTGIIAGGSARDGNKLGQTQEVVVFRNDPVTYKNCMYISALAGQYVEELSKESYALTAKDECDYARREINFPIPS
jgi:hypothetical protein